jgi:hypothetical protein
MKRGAEFKEASKHQQVTIKDSRFGIRKINLNKQEEPSVFSYANPGRTNWTYR